MTREENILNELKKRSIQTPNFHLAPSDVASNQAIDELTGGIKATLLKLQDHLDTLNIQSFYDQIEDLKYLIEYSDELNKNWYMIRAYSGALRKLLNEKTVENASNVYLYYEQTYGGRRILRSENWFEQNRWEFIDELRSVDSVLKLNGFIEKRTKKLNGFFQSYKSELLIFLDQLQKL